MMDMDKPFSNEIAQDIEFNVPNQSPGVRLVGASNENIMAAEIRQPAKITMNIPHCQLATPHKVTPSSPIRTGHPSDSNPRTISPGPGFQVPRVFSSNSFVTNTEKESAQLQTPDNFPLPKPMQLDPGVLASFRNPSSVVQRPQPVSVDASFMINRFRGQPQASNYYVPHPNIQFSNYPLLTRPQTIQSHDIKPAISPVTQVIPMPITPPPVSLTVDGKNFVHHPTPISEMQQHQFIEVNPTTTLAFVSPSVPPPPVVSSPTMIMLNDGVSITSASENSLSVLANLNQPTTQVETASNTALPNIAKEVSSIQSSNSCSQHKSPSTTVITPPVTAAITKPTATSNITPILIDPATHNTTIPSSNKESSSDKTLGKLRGPKCYRQPDHRSIPEVSLSLGPYQRPTKVPLKLKCNDIRREDVAMLVMPSEDWSCSVYPTNNRHSKYIYVISETLLNTDLVEIVRKSISIQPNWGMKFSVMATDATKFNLGLDASDISDIQAILDNFDAFPICNGIGDVSDPKMLQQLSETKVTLYSDRKIRCKECPLVLLNLADTICSPCSKLLNMSKH